MDRAAGNSRMSRGRALIPRVRQRGWGWGMGLLLVAAFATSVRAETGSLADDRLLAIVQSERELIRDAAAADQPQESLLLRTQEIVSRYETFVQDEPDHLYARILFGKFLNTIGRPEAAAGQLLVALEIDPEPAVIHQQLANSLVGSERPLEALPFFLQAVENEPSEPTYHHQLGTYLFTYRELLVAEGVLTRKSLDQQMLEAFQEAHRLAPTSLDYAVRYGEAFYDLAEPDWPLALDHWQKLVKAAPGPFVKEVFRVHEARVTWRMGYPEKALAILDTVTLESLQESVAELREAIRTEDQAARIH